MHGSQRWDFDSKRPRTRLGGILTPDTSLDPNLETVGNPPRRYWRPRSYLCESPDENPSGLDAGQFPRQPVHRKTHPVFSPNPTLKSTRLKVSSRSSKKSAKNLTYQYLRTSYALDCKAEVNSPYYLYDSASDVLSFFVVVNNISAVWQDVQRGRLSNNFPSSVTECYPESRPQTIKKRGRQEFWNNPQ
jgi:hypothetical protein